MARWPFSKSTIIKGIAYGLLFWVWVNLVASVTLEIKPELAHDPDRVYLTPYAEQVIENLEKEAISDER